ncbi:MAG: hypothetical protein WC283_03860 [Candidatus Paceibacterota bacterium]|jgi:hypothetical protein
MSKGFDRYGDINLWYKNTNGICPYCGADFTKFHPTQNIYNHFTGECKKESTCDRVVTQIQGKK